MDSFSNSLSLIRPSSGLDTSVLTAPSPFAPSPTDLSRHASLLFIDSTVSDYQRLIAGAKAGTEIYLLDSTTDAVTQITNALLGRSGVDSIHIVSHGQSGSLQLGNGQLNLATLPDYTSQIQSWSNALSDDADILLYGCDVASSELGQAFVSILSQLTGADIAASDDLTGNMTFGGDWLLESTVGSVESSLVFNTATLAAYAGALTTSPTNAGFETGNLTGWTVTTIPNGTTQNAVVINSDRTQGTYSVQLTINGSTSPYGTEYGPQLTSSYFQGDAGDRILFDWKAQDSGDDYDVKGELINATTGQTYTLFAERGDNRPWTTTAITLPTTSNQWQFRFTAGSYDATGGTGIGSTLFIDNIRVVIPTPTLDTSKSPVLTGTIEDAPAPTNGSTVGATSLSALIDNTATPGGLDNFTNPSGNPGIAVTGVNGGTLYYTTNSGSTWTQLSGTISDTSALLLSDNGTTFVYFKPNADVSGTISNAITFRAWNGFDGTSGQTAVDATTNGGASSLSDTASVTITAVNDAPFLGGLAGSINYTEGQAAQQIASSLTLSDIDSANITSATVQITGNYANGQDILAFANQLGITGSFDAIAGTLTLSGSTTLANYQTALRSVTYQNNSNNPNTLARTVTFTVNDGGATNNLGTGTRNITVTSVNTAPSLTNTPGTLSYNDGQAATAIDTGLTLTDIDSTNITGATVQITGNYANGQDVLAFSNQPGISGSFNAANGTLTLTGTATIADYQAALRAVTYQNTSNTPNTANRTVTFTVNDGGASNNIGTATRGIVVTNIDEPSVLTVSGTPTFTEGGNAVVLAPSLTVTDPDGMNGARVTIANLQTGDVLGIQGQPGSNGTINGLSWGYDANTGILTLSGYATAAVYESTLRLVTYSSTNGAINPAARNIQFSLGQTLSNPDNGHFYEFVTAAGIDWTDAQTAATNRRLFGLQGYLATITSASEQAFVQSKLQGLGWMGGSDATTEGDWRWVTGPEGLANGGAGTPFWLGNDTGAAIGNAYSNWETGEPNDADDEDYAHFLSGGRWNDYANSTFVQGYVVEYGDMPGDPTLQTTGNLTLNITTVNDAPVLDPSGSPSLTAINEDDITSTGTLISALLNSLGGTGITDPDGGSALRGVAITAVDTTNGSWEFSTNGGTTWTAIGTLGDSNARLLADNPNTRIRFVPAPNYFGTIANAISFRAWDETAGTNGGTANTSGANSGGTTAFSTAIETTGITVNPVDDAEFVVTTTADSGNGSLRQAILWANAEAGADTIRFTGSTFTDATADVITLLGELTITDDLTIVGTGADRLTFTSNAGEPARIFNVNGPAVFNLSDLAIANGNAGNGNGGGILNTGGTVSLQRVRLTGNTAAFGGAIYNAAGGTVSISNSTIDGNTATIGSGGGIANYGTLNLLNVTISGNTSPGGLGGGLYNAPTGNATLNFVTLANNTASAGGGINNGSPGTVTLRNTLIATNIGTGGAPDVFGNFTSLGNNLVSRIDFSTGINQASDLVGSSATPVNALIAPLRNVGGSTPTHRLLDGSPAINAGNNTGAPTTDQRGAVRTVSGRADIGAFEYTLQPDFNRDGKIDLIWRNTNGTNTIWQMNGVNYSTYNQLPAINDPNWQIIGNADFDGDGDPDIMWRNVTAGLLTVWEMNGPSYGTVRFLPDPGANWTMAGLADFNADGSPDIVWRDQQQGLTTIWRMNGTTYSTYTALPNVDNTWRLERVVDFNRDGSPDILWHNTVTGMVTAWRMNGFNYSTFSILGSIAANWYVEGAEDFNGDRSPDLVWRNRQTGQNAIWQMNGFSSSTTFTLGTIDASWNLERVADYDNDGSPNLLWYNRASGQGTIWRMNGFSYSSFNALPSLEPGWSMFID